MSIRAPTQLDVKNLAILARDTFTATYSAALGHELIEPYLKSAFTPEKISAEVNDPNNFFLCLEEKPNLIGYAKLILGQGPELASNPRAALLERIYLIESAQGKGAGRKLLEASTQLARNKKLFELHLSVWEGNKQAISFYFKHGFQEIGRQPYKFYDRSKGRIDEDLLMILEL